jgi:hypothetical protein
MLTNLSDMLKKDTGRHIGDSTTFQTKWFSGSNAQRGFMLPGAAGTPELHTIPAFCYSGATLDGSSALREQTRFNLERRSTYVYHTPGGGTSVVIKFRALQSSNQISGEALFTGIFNKDHYFDAARALGDKRMFIPLWKQIELETPKGMMKVRGRSLLFDYARTEMIERERLRCIYFSNKTVSTPPLKCSTYNKADAVYTKDVPRWKLRELCDAGYSPPHPRNTVTPETAVYINQMSASAPAGSLTANQRRSAMPAEHPFIMVNQKKFDMSHSAGGGKRVGPKTEQFEPTNSREVLFKLDDRDVPLFLNSMGYALSPPAGSHTPVVDFADLDGTPQTAVKLHTGCTEWPSGSTDGTYDLKRIPLDPGTIRRYYNGLSSAVGAASATRHRGDPSCGVCAAYLAAVDDWSARQRRPLKAENRHPPPWRVALDDITANMLEHQETVNGSNKWTTAVVEDQCRQLVRDNRDAFASYAQHVTLPRQPVSCMANYQEDVPCSDPETDCTVTDLETGRAWDGAEVPVGSQCPEDLPICRGHRWDYFPPLISGDGSYTTQVYGTCVAPSTDHSSVPRG